MVEKVENGGNPTIYSTQSKTNFLSGFIFNLSSANAFNFTEAKILSSGKGGDRFLYRLMLMDSYHNKTLRSAV